MCGRFNLRTPLTVLSQQFLFDLGDFPREDANSPRLNICPTQTVAIVRQTVAGKRELAMLHWGLIPSWAKDRKIAASLIKFSSVSLVRPETDERRSSPLRLAAKSCLREMRSVSASVRT